jgi:antirestriction protein ArdC
MMVCGELGIAGCDFSNNAAYVASWLEKLRSDRKEIFRRLPCTATGAG